MPREGRVDVVAVLLDRHQMAAQSLQLGSDVAEIVCELTKIPF
jgi:hypothetical protein